VNRDETALRYLGQHVALCIMEMGWELPSCGVVPQDRWNCDRALDAWALGDQAAVCCSRDTGPSETEEKRADRNRKTRE
jgi:hypothetical protein